jgi:hypothetical protein
VSAGIPLRVRKRALEQIFPPLDPHIADPVGWIRERCKRFIWSKQRQIAESVRDHRYTAVPACHGPGKTFIASGIATWWLDAHPPTESFLVTTAPSDPQVKALLWREIGRRKRESHSEGRITLDAKWYRGEKMVDEEIIGYGRKPQDYNADFFQGIHAKYVLIIIDEAGGVPKALWDALETLMTNEYARILAIGNPDDPTSYFEQVCRPGSGYNVIRIDAFSTPNFTGEPVPKDVSEQLVSQTWVDERRKKWGIGSPLYQSKVLALFPEISDDTLITPNMVRIAQAKKIEPTLTGQYGFDIARFGSDETVGYRNQNGYVRRVYNKHKQDTVLTTNAIHMFMLGHGVDYVPAVVDVVGVGGGVVDQLRARDLNVIPFDSGEKAFAPKRFANRRAEVYWKLRQLFEEHRFDIDPLDEELAAQLTSIKWFVTHGRIQIESKEQMKRRGLPSPDRADAFMMATSALDSFIEAQDRYVPVPSITGDLLAEVM